MTLCYILVTVHGFAMKLKFMFVVLLFGGAVYSAPSRHLPVNPGGIGGIFEGPNSETIIKGPDGSVITSAIESGTVAEIQPIIVAESVIPLDTTPVEIIQQDPHIIETEIVDAPVIEPKGNSDLVGPSGSISTRGSSSVVSGPASTTISEPARVVIPATPVIASVTTPLLAQSAIGIISNGDGSLVSLAPPTISVSSPIPVSLNNNIISSTLQPPVSLQPSAVSIGNNIISSTLQPSAVSISNTGNNVISSTLQPPTISIGQSVSPTPQSINSAAAAATIEQANLEANQQIAAIQAKNKLSNDLAASITQQANLQASQEIAAIQANSKAIIDQAQLLINSNPEIGLKTGGVVQQTPIIASTISPNIQRTEAVDGAVLTNNLRPVNVNGRLDALNDINLQQKAIQNQLVLSELSHTNSNNINLLGQSVTPNGVPLLTETNPIQTNNNQNILAAELTKLNIDPSQIQLANIPLSQVTRIDGVPINQQVLLKGNQDISAAVWNRYGRGVKKI